MNVLALNSGSSSVKFAAYRTRAGEPELCFAGESGAIAATVSTAPLVAEIRARAATARISLDAIGHRIVHGGALLRQPCLIDDRVLEQLDAAAAFAPVHAAPALALLGATREGFPGVPQVACFDTGFHAAMPLAASTLPVDRVLARDGIQRYGFHGLSCESIVRQLGADLPDRVVIAHLGHGCSVTAVRAGHSVDTTMGLTPSGGVIMGTRSGDLDPGLLLYLMRERGFDQASLEELVDHKSGLGGISGVSSDMRKLHEAAAENADARLAIEMFAIAVRKAIAAMATVLGGVDLVVFTGGIGEHDWQVRAMTCDSLAWMGIALDRARNRATARVITAAGSAVEVQVLPSEEEAEIARHVATLLA